jgi:phosphoribosyl 1,2-cyclic phosphodiesterase
MPTPGPRTIRTGGNTSCVSVDIGGELLIFDAGSGLRELGMHLVDVHGSSPTRATVLLSHYHWDHLLGFPGFAPIFTKGSELVIFGEGKQTGDARTALEHQFAAPHFPVPFDEIAATLDFHAVTPGERFDVAGAIVRVGRLNHPNLAVAYRVEVGGRSVVYATDHEHSDPQRHLELQGFAHGADLLIYDCTYDDATYPQFRGWGHSTWQEGIALAERARVGQFVIFHHDPARDDDAVDRIEDEAKGRMSRALVAREGLVIDL